MQRMMTPTSTFFAIYRCGWRGEIARHRVIAWLPRGRVTGAIEQLLDSATGRNEIANIALGRQFWELNNSYKGGACGLRQRSFFLCMLSAGVVVVGGYDDLAATKISSNAFGQPIATAAKCE
jgi:hypothetical protein